jgi:cell division protein YceG involved in septum cleavage
MLDSTDHSRHVFSKTIKEHNALVQKFLKKGAPSTIQRSFDN